MIPGPRYASGCVPAGRSGSPPCGAPAPAWAAGAVALLVAGERFAAGRPLNPAVQGVAHSLLGAARPTPRRYAELRERLPARLAWVLEQADVRE